MPVTNLAHKITFYGSFHGRSLFLSSNVPQVVIEDVESDFICLQTPCIFVSDRNRR